MISYTDRTGRKGLSAFVLRMIAWAAMIMGCIWTFVEDSAVDWFTYMLYFSFSIFAFLLSEGVHDSGDKKKYFLRLLVFTVISEPVYDLFFYDTYWETSGQSIMLTIFIGAIVLFIVDFARNKLDNMIVTTVLLIILGILASMLCVFLKTELSDYETNINYGIVIICLYYFCSNVTYSRLMLIICFVVFVLYSEATNFLNILWNDLYYSVPDKTFALLALIPIWFYNGKRGPNTLALKWIYYLFFPVLLGAMLLLKKIGFSL